MPNVERPTSNIECNSLRDWAFSVGRYGCSIQPIARLAPDPIDRQDSLPHEGKKCYNFGLAMSGKVTASCMSTRTATLLLVVDRYSQVLGAAVHQYCQLIRTSTLLLPP